MSLRPEGWPDSLMFEPMTRERFEQVLIGVRNAAALRVPEDDFSLSADQRAIWHAAEVALGILRPGYGPKLEALSDMRALLAWADGEDASWPATN